MERPSRPVATGQGAPAVQDESTGAPSAEAALRASNLLLRALTEVQTEFIQGHGAHRLFDKLLSVMLEVTGSEYGFIGEVLRTPEGTPYLSTHAITNIAWTDELRAFYAREAPTGMEFRNLRSLFGTVMTTGEAVVANLPESDPRRGGLPEGHPPLRCFLGLPFHSATELVGMVGIANRQGGYDAGVIDFLKPLLATCCAILQGVRGEQRRRHVEEELRNSAESFRTLIERTPNAIFIHREGRVLFTNPSAVVLMGVGREEELRDKSVTELVLPGDEGTFLEPSGMRAPREARFRHHEGRRVLGEVVTVPLVFGGQPALVSIARDITERQQVQEKLLATERMVSLGTLAAGVAHEINNPLSYMLSNLSFVDDELDALAAAGEGLQGERGQEVRDALKEAISGSARVRDIVRDLKSFSRGTDDEQRGPVDMRVVLDSCVNMAWSEIRHRARLVKDYGEVPFVLGNESRLGQLFLNLLVNAAQAIPHGNLQGNEIRLTLTSELGEVVVAVRDTGEGIAPENLGRLFDPFFTTKPVGVGTGLGLSICHGIVTAMGGRISVESERGRGTTFRVFLPTVRE
ncbi:MAG TPA: ATP-binding protein [Archangium sp.]|jgi:PAS domain S-box-containing protein|uniref:ATP-binding protein n=1 Tax=Archangium sp. TaxID=1872627 RepID=UPI002EDB9E9D